MDRPGRHLFNVKTLTLLGVTSVLLLSLTTSAMAQQGAGAFTGVVTDNATGKALDGVVVLVKSPNMQQEQITATDASGYYRIVGLPPGTYSVQFDKEGYFPNARGSINLRSDTTLRVNSALAPAVGAADDVVITQRPVVDVGSSGTTTTLDSEMLKRVPLSAPGGKGSASRTFESVAEATPRREQRSLRRRRQRLHIAREPLLDRRHVGGQPRQGHRRHLPVDGVRAGGQRGQRRLHAGVRPGHGRHSERHHQVRLEQLPRPVFTFFSPGALEGDRKLVQQSAQPVAYATELSYVGDIGFDLGGPIIKDKLWFYTGFDVSNTAYNIKRGVFRTADRGSMATPDGTIETTPIFSQNYVADARTVQGMAKLTWSLNSDNRLTLAAYGTPTFSGGGAKFDGQNVTGGKYSIDPLTGNPESGGNGTFSSNAHQFVSTPIDATVKLNSQFLDKKLLLDVMFGTHYQKDSMRAADGSKAGDTSGLASLYNVNWRRNTPDPVTGRPNYHSISDFETFDGSQRCNEAGFDCLVSDYVSGAPRDLNEALYNRYHSSVIVSYLANFLGHHLIKVGDRRRVHQLQEHEVEPGVRRVRGRQPVRRRGALRHPHRSRHGVVHRPAGKEDVADDGGRLHPGQLERDGQGHGEPGLPLRHPVLLQHRGQRRPVAAQPVVAAPGSDLRPHPDRQGQDVRQLRPLLRERAARLCRRGAGGRAPGARRPRL